MPERILVRGPNWVGDVVMATPVLRSLRRTFPDAHITLALKSYVVPLAVGLPSIDEILEIPQMSLIERLRFWWRLRDHHFDLGIVLTNSFGSALDLFLTGARRRRGYVAEGRGLLLNERVRPLLHSGQRKAIPMVEFYQRIIAGLGCVLDEGHYELATTASDDSAARAFLERQGLDAKAKIIGLNPGAKFGSSKLWLAERFSELADRLFEAGHQPLLLGGPGEEQLLDLIQSQAKHPLPGGAADILALGPLKALMKKLDLLVTTDTGPRAMAQAFQLPHVVLMGPTDPAWTQFNMEGSRLLRHQVPCGPCHKKICDLDHRCMTQITVDEVVMATQSLLKPV